jgi:hypothetical protein
VSQVYAVTDERSTLTAMLGWVWIVVLYVLGMGFFRWLGGIGAAADAISTWGRATAERRRRQASFTA